MAARESPARAEAEAVRITNNRISCNKKQRNKADTRKCGDVHSQFFILKSLILFFLLSGALFSAEVGVAT
jgi:hypothetical protein